MTTPDRDSQDSGSSLLHDEKASLLDELNYVRTTQCRQSSTGRSWLLTIVAVVATNILSILATIKFDEGRLHEAYSPDFTANRYAFPGLDRSYSRVKFSEHVFNGSSRWSGPPSPVVDRAWVALGVRDAGFLVPASVGQKAGLDMREHLYLPPGTIEDPKEEGFFVLVQGFHDLHCLNELRKALYFNKPYYKQYEDDTVDPEWFRQSHIRHCLDNVRERLMCTADIGLIPSVYTSPDTETIQFANTHKCHSYDALIDWKRKWEANHQSFVTAADGTKPLPVLPPPDAIFRDPSKLN